jgi:nucleoside-diphosphate-sugar epimerase
MDICDRRAVAEFFKRHLDADAVIHLASFPRQKVVNLNPVRGADVMCSALVNLLEQTSKCHIKKFVYISSSMVYGDFSDGVTEDAVCKPLGQYAILKYQGEKLVEDYTRRGHFDHVIVRPSAVYGEWDVEDRVVSKFMMAAMRGESIRINGSDEVLDFTHVEDAAQGIVLAATNPAAANQIFNITRSADAACTLGAVAGIIMHQVGITDRGVSGTDVHDRDPNFPSRGRLCIDKARNLLDYNPKIDVFEGFARYHNWFQGSTYWQQRL